MISPEELVLRLVVAAVLGGLVGAFTGKTHSFLARVVSDALLRFEVELDPIALTGVVVAETRTHLWNGEP